MERIKNRFFTSKNEGNGSLQQNHYLTQDIAVGGRAPSPHASSSSRAIVSENVKKGSIAITGFGLFLTFLGLIISATGNFGTSLRFLGWGMMFVAIGPSVPLHLLLFYSKEGMKVKATYAVATVGLYGIIANSFLTSIFIDQIICQRWFFIYYDPDAGNCKCDDRTLLETNDSPLYVPQDSFNFGSTIKIATIGDTSLDDGKKAMRLAKSKGIDLFVINGDLTYEADPEALDETLTDIFGRNFPVMITVGNHDTGIFTEYQEVIQDRYDRYRRSVSGDQNQLETLLCDGQIGVSQQCSFYNMGFVFNGLGSTCSTDEILNQELEQQLEDMTRHDVMWKLVYIHKNQRLLQTGGKINEVGYEAFEKSIEHGAVVLNGHEHTYARTKELYSVGFDPEDFTFIEEPNQEFLNGLEVINVKPGSSMVVANGLGGQSIRDVEDNLDQNPWWSSTFNDASDGINYAVHVCEYGVENQKNLAYCYFETIDGLLVDEYYLRSGN